MLENLIINFNLDELIKLQNKKKVVISMCQINFKSIEFDNVEDILFTDTAIEILNELNSFSFKDSINTTINSIRFNLKHDKYQKQSLFKFENVTNITISNINLTNFKFIGNLFEFVNVKLITIESLQISDTQIVQNLIKCSGNIATDIKINNIIVKNTFQEYNDNNNVDSKIFSLVNVNTFNLTNFTSENLQNIGILNLTANLKNVDAMAYLTNITNINSSKIQFPLVFIEGFSKIKLQQINITIFMNTKMIQSSTSIIKIIQSQSLNIYKINFFNSTNLQQHKRTLDEIGVSLNQQTIISNKQRLIQSKQSNKQSLLLILGVKQIYFEDFKVQSFIQFQILNIDQYDLTSVEQVKINLMIVQNSKEQSQIQNSNFIYNESPVYINAAKCAIQYSRFQRIYSSKSLINIKSQNIYIQGSNFTELEMSSSVIDAENANKLVIIECLFQQVKEFFILQNILELKIIKSTFKNKNQTSDLQSFTIKDVKFLFIQESTFQDNTSLNFSGALQLQTINFLLIDKCEFLNNQSKEGGGGSLQIESSNTTIISTNFINNNAKKYRGGAINIISGQLMIIKSDFKENEALIGGAISNYQNKSNIYYDPSTKYISNKGSFYGDNYGSYPYQVGQLIDIYNQEKKQQLSEIFIASFGSGQSTELDIQIMDKDNKVLNFTNQYLKEEKSELMKQELNTYNFYLEKNNQTQIPSQNYTSENSDNYKLNAAIQYKSNQEQTIQLKSNFDEHSIITTVKIQFRNCQIGEIIVKKNDFIQCEKCGVNTYSVIDPNLEEHVSCLQCPFEAEKCEGGSKITLKDGYWRPNNLSDNIYKCDLKGCSELNLLNKNGCLKGHIGPLCQSCDSQRTQWGEQYGLVNKSCQKCKDFGEQYVYFALIFFAYLIYFSYGFTSLVKRVKINYQLNIFRRMGVLALSKQEFIGRDVEVSMKIFLSYIQILSQSSLFLNNRAQGFKSIIDIGGDPSEQSAKGLNCSVKFVDVYPLWFHKFITTLSQIIVFTLILMIVQKVYQKSNKIKRNYFKMIFIFLYIFYQPSFSKLLISLIFFIKIDKNYYLLNDYSQEYFEGYHKYYSIYIIYPFSFLFCIILPILLLRKIKLNVKSGSYVKADYIFSYQLLSVGFQRKRYYWEILRIMYKFIIMVILNLSTSYLNQSYLIIVVVLIYYQLLILKQPFNNNSHFNIDKKLTFLIVISLLLQLFLNPDTSDSLVNNQFQSFLIAVIVILNILGVLMWIQTLLKAIRLPYPNPTSQFLKQILKKLEQIKVMEFIEKNKIIEFRKVSIFRTHQLWLHIKKNIKNGNFYQSEINFKMQLLSKRSTNYNQNGILNKFNRQSIPTLPIGQTKQQEIDEDQKDLLIIYDTPKSIVSMLSIPPERINDQDQQILQNNFQNAP